MWSWKRAAVEFVFRFVILLVIGFLTLCLFEVLADESCGWALPFAISGALVIAALSVGWRMLADLHWPLS